MPIVWASLVTLIMFYLMQAADLFSHGRWVSLFVSALLAALWFKLLLLFEKLGADLKEEHERELAEKREWSENLSKRFPGCRLHCFEPDRSYCVVDPKKEQIVICDPSNDLDETVLSYDQLFGIQLLRNGEKVVESDGGAVIGGALAGSLLFGPVGGIVGGLSGPKTSVTKISRIVIRLRIDDTDHPLFDLCFFRNHKPLEAGDERVRKAVKEAETFAAVLQNILTKRRRVQEAKLVGA